jgi:hypothetical protein
MPTQAQIDANRQNATLSTGPRTESGKSTSSRNALTLGLYTRQDYVKPDERDLYREFCETMHLELDPANLLEETLVSEITGASWRLRRCSAAEGELADYAIQDPLLDETKAKTIRSIERARSTASSLLHRGINQLRRLQTDRRKLTGHPAVAAPADAPELAPDCTAMPCPPALRSEALPEPPAEFLEELDAILAEYAALGSNCSPPAPAPKLASNCSPAAQTPRSAPCPCKSGEKFKRCCGKNAPPVLSTAARRAA